MSLTDLVDLGCTLAMLVDNDHLGVDQRLVLDEECRPESHHFHILDQFDVAKQAMNDLVDLGAERVNMLPLAIDKDVLESVPRRALEEDCERVVTGSGDVLIVERETCQSERHQVELERLTSRIARQSSNRHGASSPSSSRWASPSVRTVSLQRDSG